MAILILVAGASLIAMEYRNKMLSRILYAERMDPNLTEPGLTPAEARGNHNYRQSKVEMGVYVDRIVELSMKEMNWKVDFYVWFRWQDSGMVIGDNFQVVDGWIETKEKKNEYHQGNDHYVLYRVVARITSVFEEFRFPCDDHLLTICIEDPSFDRSTVIWDADSINSSVSSRVRVPGYKMYKMAVVEKPHSYKTSRGDPRLKDGAKATYSQFRMGLWIKRESWGFFLKMFLPLFVAVAVALLAFFINPAHSDPRFGLGIGALFAAVANSYITSSMLPNTGVLALADIINLVGTSNILLTLILSAISLYIYERRGKHELSHRFDRIAFYIITFGYAALNIALPLAATYRGN
jgi:hypothetical protein